MKNNIPHRVHFVGIGGIGMSSLAQHLLRCGFAVSGSDRQENAQTQKLRAAGARVRVPHGSDVCGAQLVVRTSAVPTENSEVAFALQQGIPVILREQLLGMVFDSFATRIAVCGTHGKTTVTAMLHHVLERCGVGHAAFIGGEYHGENYFFGTNTAVAEACEYNRGFLQLHPTLCLCLNVEFDHPDCYKNLHDVELAFEKLFAQSTQTVAAPSVLRLWQSATVVGRELAAKNIGFSGGLPHFDLYCGENFVYNCKMKVCGEHNIGNALAVATVARELKLPLLQVAQALCSFDGVDRRWTEKQSSLCRVVCDYAHHPTEIRAAVATARRSCRGKIFAVFQPHTYSRTQAFLSGFVDCFDGVDTVVYLPVYSARETPDKGATSNDLLARAAAQGRRALLCNSFADAAAFLRAGVSSQDMVLLVGAGDVDQLSELLV